MQELEAWYWPETWYMGSSKMSFSIPPSPMINGALGVPHQVCPSPYGEGWMHMNVADSHGLWGPTNKWWGGG